ncbi:hypothetical protein P3S67_006511 [Capsicum chacoense]
MPSGNSSNALEQWFGHATSSTNLTIALLRWFLARYSLLWGFYPGMICSVMDAWVCVSDFECTCYFLLVQISCYNGTFQWNNSAPIMLIPCQLLGKEVWVTQFAVFQ